MGVGNFHISSMQKEKGYSEAATKKHDNCQKGEHFSEGRDKGESLVH